jgi:hypothetical protein
MAAVVGIRREDVEFRFLGLETKSGGGGIGWAEITWARLFLLSKDSVRLPLATPCPTLSSGEAERALLELGCPS